MQSTPYEVKRLEYQLRIDAASRCPGTDVIETESPDFDENPEPVIVRVSLIQRAATAITAILRGREHAEAS